MVRAEKLGLNSNAAMVLEAAHSILMSFKRIHPLAKKWTAKAPATGSLAAQSSRQPASG
jgi:hypothetical protein